MLEKNIDAARSFNRYFTQRVGTFENHFLGTDLNLPEARVLFEIATNEPVTASDIQSLLSIDKGYLSRILSRFEKKGIVKKYETEIDARSRVIRLTARGREIFAEQDRRQREVIQREIGQLSIVEQNDLMESMAKVRLLLNPEVERPKGYSLRPFRTGDIGVIASRQSLLYAESHGWGHQLEAVIMETASVFLRDFKPDREQCFVAELSGVIAGAAFLTDEKEGTARIRLVYVEPFARRRGIGDALISKCVDFACEKKYAEILLWTQSILESARRIYARHGFTITSTFMHEEFGTPVQGEMWRKLLSVDS